MYDTVNNLIKKFKITLYVISPSFAFYNELKDRKNLNDKERKENNKNVSNLMKALYFSLTTFVILLFSIYDFTNRINENKTILSNGIFLIIILLTFLLFLISLYFKRKYLKAMEKYMNNKHKIINMFLKRIEIIYVFGIASSIFLCIYTNNQANIEKYIFWILLYFYGVSRPVHFFLVFIPDFIKKLETNDGRDNEGKLRLIILAVFSYFNMVLDYTVLFYSLNILVGKYFNGMHIFDNNITNIIDMLYYTIGCNTLLANNFIMKFYAILLKLSVAILISGNLANYISMKEKQTK